jgi:malate synthase
MTGYVKVGGLSVAEELFLFLKQDALPGSGISPEQFWSGYASIIQELSPQNKILLEFRDKLQNEIDTYHVARRGSPLDMADYMSFLKRIGYLQDEPAQCSVNTANVDAEVAEIAGPQLVVPMSNARYSLNAGAASTTRSTAPTPLRTKANWRGARPLIRRARPASLRRQKRFWMQRGLSLRASTPTRFPTRSRTASW